MGDTKYKAAHRAAGLCLFCSKPAIPGMTLCEKHIITNRESKRKYHDADPKRDNLCALKQKHKRIKEGRCRDCSGPLSPETDDGHRCCFNCRHKLYASPTFLRRADDQVAAGDAAGL